jgi:CRISPR-associated protein Cmr2
MASYLYVLSIGPVQDFIAAARRTKDLWYGSYIISVISKAAAREIANSGGHLIFPGLDKGDPRLESLENEFSVANVILARLPDGTQSPEILNKKAQDAAKREWIALAEKARSGAGNAVRRDKIGQDIWNDQVEDAIDFYAAWVPESISYKKDHMKVMRLLAGRKSIRDFRQPEGRFGIPKSSLDGARESVIQGEKSLPKSLSMKLRLNAGEQLCAIGLTKRLGKRPDGKNAAFPSVVRVAADPWIRGIRRHPGDEANRILDEIEACCRESENSFSTGTGDRLYQDFPFDGQILYPFRLARAKDNLKDISTDLMEDNPFRDDPNKLSQIEIAINKLEKKDNGGLGLGEPNQYLAILKADGDRMGNALSAIESAVTHKAFSGQLAEFASDAKKKVENEFHGCVVYSGGDDVLAFLPLDTCLDAARALHEIFGEKLAAFLDDKGNPLTLSVGIAIGHFLEPLENLLNFGIEAEKAAKDGRDAEDEKDGLAVHIYPRSGAPIKIRQKWMPKKGNGLDERLSKWAEMHFKNELPDSCAYEMHELAEDYRNWKTSSKDGEDKLRDLIVSDALRLLKRKTGGLNVGPLLKEDLRAMLKNADPYEAIRRMADELILARRIAVAMKQARDQKSPKKEKPTQEVA